MIQRFDRKEKLNLKTNSEDKMAKYTNISRLPKETLTQSLSTSIEGLSSKEALLRLNQNGLNKVVKDEKKTWFTFFLLAFKDQFILILIVLACINFFLGDKLGSFIILGIIFASALVRFFQDYSTYKFNQLLKSKIYSSAIVVRDKKEIKLKTEQVVIGDVVKLNAGSIIPADLRIMESKDLFLNQSVFTGESIPIEKKEGLMDADTLFELSNICFMGSSVISGTATAVVIETGFSTYLGAMGQEIGQKPELTSFQQDMNHITKLLIRYMVIVCFFVLIVNGLLRGDFKEAILFALSVAVGITPSMLPMIVNVNLTKGSKNLAQKKTLVKRIESIQNLGAIDILCTDKTGTLTEDNITLQQYIDLSGNTDFSILESAYLNSYFGTGMKNLIDRAIISYAKKNKMESLIQDYVKIDEIPFDYNRRKMSVIVKKQDDYRIITKGALEEILKSCTVVRLNQQDVEMTEAHKVEATKQAQLLASTGMQVIALAERKEYPGVGIFDQSHETDMTFIGLVGFFDPPKKEALRTLNKLREVGIHTKVLTGDNPYATKNICQLCGLNSDSILLGSDVDAMTDEELSKVIETVDIFARLNPLQKERIVHLYRKNGHVVGYMGDGVNDAPSLHKADVGISVDSATDIAKEASDLILLEKNLEVIYDGVMEGRKVYGNIIKYMKMALSSDFGDVFSIMIASIFLPFLPLLPIQMLIQDFIYDFSQIGIPYDNVDEEFLKTPKRWNTKGISKFMNVMGITSSLIDVGSFLIFWFVFGYNSIDKQAYFQTAWFVICLITELMIIHNVRTSKKPFIESCASKPLLWLTLFSLVLTVVTPILLSPISSFHFVCLPMEYYLYALVLVIGYFFLISIIKKIYIKREKEWL